MIDWNAKRTVVEATESGEHYVKVGDAYMLATEYVSDGGRVEDNVGVHRFVATMTNAQLQREYA